MKGASKLTVAQKRATDAEKTCSALWKNVWLNRIALMKAIYLYRSALITDPVRAYTIYRPAVRAKLDAFRDARKKWEEEQSFLLMCVEEELLVGEMLLTHQEPTAGVYRECSCE